MILRVADRQCLEIRKGSGPPLHRVRESYDLLLPTTARANQAVSTLADLVSLGVPAVASGKRKLAVVPPPGVEVMMNSLRWAAMISLDDREAEASAPSSAGVAGLKGLDETLPLTPSGRDSGSVIA